MMKVPEREVASVQELLNCAIEDAKKLRNGDETKYNQTERSQVGKIIDTLICLRDLAYYQEV